MRRISSYLVKFRLFLFLTSLAFIFASSIGLKNVTFSSDYKIFFADDDPHFQAYQEIESTYTPTLNVIFVLAPEDKNIFTTETLTAIQWLTQRAWKIPHSARVESLTNFQFTSADGDELRIDDLVPGNFNVNRTNTFNVNHTNTNNNIELQLIKHRAMNEPLMRHRLISPDSSVSALVITLEVPNQNDPTPDLHTTMNGAHGVNQLVDEFRKTYPSIAIRISGIAAMNHAMEQVATEDLARLMPCLLVVILALIGIMTRSFSNAMITQIIIIAAMMATLGIVGHLGFKLNNISGFAPLIILTLAVANSIHLLSYYSRQLGNGHNTEEAMRISLVNNARAVFITSITTTAGFLGMNASDSPPYVDLGNIAAGGIVLAFLFSHTLLPQLAIWFSKARATDQIKPHTIQHATQYPKAVNSATGNTPTLAIVNKVIAHPRKVFFGTLLLSVLISSWMFENEINDDNIGYFRQGIPIRDAYDFAEAHKMPMNHIEYSMDSGEPYGITNTEYLRQVDGFVNWLRMQPEVVQATSFIDILKRLNQNMHGGDPAWFRLPESRELTSQYLLLYEMSLPLGMDINNLISAGQSALRVSVQSKMLKAKQNIELDDRAQQWLSENAPALKTPGSSLLLMFAHISQKNINSLMLGSAFSMAIICLCMVLGLGSIKLGLIAILPNIFPASIMLGLWGIFVGEVNLAVAVVFTVTAGIIVDDTIHLFSKVADGLRKGFDIDTAIRYSFQHAGPGVLITTAVLSAGFAMLIFADFMPNVTLGIMVSATILIAIIFDVLFLPSALKMFYWQTKQAQNENSLASPSPISNL